MAFDHLKAQSQRARGGAVPGERPPIEVSPTEPGDVETAPATGTPVTPRRRVHRRACVPRRAHRPEAAFFDDWIAQLNALNGLSPAAAPSAFASGAATRARPSASIRRGCPVVRDGGHVHRARAAVIDWLKIRKMTDDGWGRLPHDTARHWLRGWPPSTATGPRAVGRSPTPPSGPVMACRPCWSRSWPRNRRTPWVSALRRVENAPRRSGDAKHATTTARRPTATRPPKRTRRRPLRWPRNQRHRARCLHRTPAVGIEPAGVGSSHRGGVSTTFSQFAGACSERRRRFQDRLQERLLSCCGTVIRHAGYRPRGGARRTGVGRFRGGQPAIGNGTLI